MTYYSNYKFLKLNYNRNIPLSNMKSLKKQLKTVLLEKKKKVIKAARYFIEIVSNIECMQL